jgi:drug/metabolite transporter (DMT)-like permease
MGGVLISGSAALLTGGAGTLGTWASEPVAWLAVIVAGTLGAAIPKVMLLVGVRRIGGTRTATVMLSEPVMAVAFAAIALGQEVVPAEIVGGAAILVGAALVQRPSRHDAAARGVRRTDAAWAPHE